MAASNHFRSTKPLKIGAIEFIGRVIKLDEKGDPWKLSAYQRRVLVELGQLLDQV
jgi:hypothetical protein